MALNNLGLGLVLTAENLASAVITGVQKDLADLAKQPEKLTAAFREAGGEMKKAGLGLMGIGIAGLAGLGVAVNESAKFGRAIAETGTLIDHAKFSTDEMRVLTQQMATQFGGDLATQTKALYQGISSGADSATKAQGLLTAANRLAIAGATDQATAITGLTKVMNNYGIDFANAADVSDAFFVAIKGGQTTAGELGNAVGEVAAGAKSAGIQMDEMIAALGTGATLMRDTAGATTGLKAALAGLSHPTADAEAEAKKLGIQFGPDAVKKYGGFQNFLNAVTSSAGFTSKSMNNLFGSQEAANTMTALAANGGAAYNAMMKEMGNRAGGTAQAFEEMSATLEQQGSVLKANFQVALTQVGDVLAPLLSELAKGATALVKAFTTMPAGLKKALVVLVAIGSAFALAAGAAVFLSGAILAAVAMGKVLLVTMVAMFAIVSGVGVLFAAAALAVVGFKQAVEQNIGGIGDFFRDLYTKGRLLVDGLGQLFSQGGFSGPVLEQLNAGNQGIKDFAITVYLWANRIVGFFDGLKQGFANAVAAAKPALDQFKLALSGVLTALGMSKDAPDEAGKKFQSFADTGASVGQTLGKVFEFLVEAITAGMRVARGFIGGMRAMAPVFAQVWTAVTNIIGAFTSMGAATGSSGSAWEGFGQKVGYVVGLVGAGVAVLANLIAVHMTVITSAISGVIGFFGGLLSVFQGIWNVIAGILTGDWKQVWQGVVQIVSGSVQAIISLVASVVSALAGVGDIVGKILGKDLGMKKFVEGVKGDALKAVAAGPGQMAQDAAGIVQATPTTSAATGLVQPPAAVPAGAPIAAAGATVPAAAAGAQAGSLRDAVAGMSRNAASTPVQVEAKTTLVVDGEVLASTVTKHQQSGQARSFGAVPSPT